MTLKLPDDLADRLSDLQKRSDTLVKKALEEGGKHGQAAKPFMTPAKRSAQKLCIEAMRKIFEEGVDSL